MSVVVGCDLSTFAVDLVAVDENTLHATWTRCQLEGGDAFDRARSVRDALRGFDWSDVLAVGIEDPRGHNAGVIYRVQGAVLSSIPVSVLVTPWVPSAWRKAVGLSGRADKGRVESWAKARIGVTYPQGQVHMDFSHPSRSWPSDACDAYCIALATLAAIEQKEAA